MYRVEKGSLITVTASDGSTQTGLTPMELRFKRQHMRYRPLKSERLVGTFTFVWNRLTITVSGQYLLQDFTDESDQSSYAQPGFVGPRPRRHFFRPSRKAC